MIKTFKKPLNRTRTLRKEKIASIKPFLMLNSKSIISVFLGLFFVLTFIFRLSASSTISAKSVELHELTEKKAVLEKEVLSLTYQKAQLTSMSEVYDRATKLGMIPAEGNLLSVEVSNSPSIAAITVR